MFFKKRILGIDIGTDAIKIVEISALGKHMKLENYAQVHSSSLSKESLLNIDEKGNLASSQLISSAIRDILKESKIKTKKVVFSIPDFLTFSTYFEIPPMPEKEIAGAVYYNASKYLTLPSSEVTLDWKIIPSEQKDNNSIKIFLIAVSNQVIKEYRQIARSIGLELYAMEPEVFGIKRSLIGSVKDTICFLDMGAKTSTINIVDNGYLKRSYSFNIGGNQLSDDLMSTLKISLSEAEKIKIDEGLMSKKEEAVRVIKNSVDQIFLEIKNISSEFLEKEKKQIKEFYITGGLSSMPGLKSYFADKFKSSVYMPNYFLELYHPKILDDLLNEMSPRFSAVVGVALGILEV